MAIIRRLDNVTINQIAAGEVVERPSSIVKELVENSIDADASAITVDIENGGTTLIRVTDNGIGMDEEDAESSFQRHATSKIQAANDLNHIHTLGFRGEALASIAAVTQMEMLTRQRGSISGHHIIYHGGQMMNASEAGCPEGTTILVRNLFYNTPARLKFLKSSRSETAAISDLLARLILANPHISIKYISNGRTVYHSPGSDSLLGAIISIYGKDIKDELIRVNDDLDNGFSFSGYVGKPSLSRTNRVHQSFFVNGRHVRSPLLSQCVEDSLKEQTMINHFPWCVISIQVPPQEVDVNVHPSKTEIRFRDPQQIVHAFKKILKGAVEAKPYIPTVIPSTQMHEKTALSTVHGIVPNIDHTRPESIPEHNNLKSSKAVYCAELLSEIREQPAASRVYIQEENQEEIFTYSGMNGENDDNTINAYDLGKCNVIGSAFSTFILVETDTQLYIIDQHAAHERLVYEQLKESIRRQEVRSQQLLPPYILEVTHDEFISVTENMDSFLSVGFEIEPFGGKSFLIRGIPVVLKEANIRSLFHELLDQPSSRTGQERLMLQDEDIIKMSCKKAVKANDKLSQQEIRNLLKDIDQKKIPLTCPHGRPILISMSRYELEKKFKRIQ